AFTTLTASSRNATAASTPSLPPSTAASETSSEGRYGGLKATRSKVESLKQEALSARTNWHPPKGISGGTMSVPTTKLKRLTSSDKFPPFPEPISRQASPENLARTRLRSKESSEAR